MFRDSACGIGENVAAVALVEPGPFFVEVFVISEYSAFGKFLRSAEGIFGLNEFVDAILYFFNMISADGKIFVIGYHIGVQFAAPQAGVSPVEPGVSVRFDEDCRVNVAARITDKGRSYSVGEWSCRTVGYGHAYSHVMSATVHAAYIPVESTVALDTL